MNPVESRTAASNAPSPGDLQSINELKELYGRMRAELGKVIIGQGDVVQRILICILARGHALLMGVPGLAKTLMINSLSQVMSLDFNRIQFTPDLMPATSPARTSCRKPTNRAVAPSFS